MINFIRLSTGQFAIVDRGDHSQLNNYSWYLHNGYARAATKTKQILMHRMILAAGEQGLL